MSVNQYSVNNAGPGAIPEAGLDYKKFERVLFLNQNLLQMKWDSYIDNAKGECPHAIYTFICYFNPALAGLDCQQLIKRCYAPYRLPDSNDDLVGFFASNDIYFDPATLADLNSTGAFHSAGCHNGNSDTLLYPPQTFHPAFRLLEACITNKLLMVGIPA